MFGRNQEISVYVCRGDVCNRVNMGPSMEKRRISNTMEKYSGRRRNLNTKENYEGLDEASLLDSLNIYGDFVRESTNAVSIKATMCGSVTGTIVLNVDFDPSIYMGISVIVSKRRKSDCSITINSPDDGSDFDLVSPGERIRVDISESGNGAIYFLNPEGAIFSTSTYKLDNTSEVVLTFKLRYA